MVIQNKSGWTLLGYLDIEEKDVSMYEKSDRRICDNNVGDV